MAYLSVAAGHGCMLQTEATDVGSGSFLLGVSIAASPVPEVLVHMCVLERRDRVEKGRSGVQKASAEVA